MNTSMPNLRSRRALAGAALTVACVAVSVPAATAASAAVHPAVASCATSQLRAGMGDNEGAAGSVITSIDFTNTSGVTCTLYGYPGVSLSEGSPYTQVGMSSAWNSATPKTLVTLAPGAVASSVLKITDAYNYPSGTCDPTPTTYLVVYPPNNSVPIHLKYSAVTCADQIQTMTANAITAGTATD
jgi:Protein of unknown function (DUF4232)